MSIRSNKSTLRRLPGSRLLATLALAASTGCATSDRVALRPPDHPARVRVAPVTQPKTQVTADRQVEHAVVDEASPQPGGIEQMAHADDAAAELATPRSVDADGFIVSGQSPVPACEPIPYAPVPRMPVMQGCPPGMPCPPFVGPVGPLEEPPYPEELLCDGGDAGYPFHYEGDEFSGLEPEDTVAEFTDHEGTAHVRISSKACVYAPKFAAVRSISQPVQGIAVNTLGGTHRFNTAAGFQNRNGLIVAENVDQLADTRVREQANSVNTDVAEDAMHQNVGLDQHIKLMNVFEDRNALNDGQFQQTTEAYLASTLQVAGESIRDIGPIIVANDVFGQAVTSIDSVEAYIAVEDRRPPGDLRVVKLADQQAVQPGELVTFRIRFYNDGGRELTSLRILDHLSPRLEYVAGSVSSELEGKLDVEEDDYGGQILRFELGTELEAGASGEISFQAMAK